MRLLLQPKQFISRNHLTFSNNFQPVYSFIQFFLYHFQFIQKILIRLSQTSCPIIGSR